MLLKQAQENGVDLDEEQLLFLAGRQANTFDDEVDEGPVQDMAQNEDNIFQADQCDVFDSDVDEAPTAQTLFMANLTSADVVYDEAGPSYDSDTLSEIQDHDNCLDNINESHEEHDMNNDVQPNDVVDSNTEYLSNIILYEQYVQDKEDHVVHNDVSFVPNDAITIITNDIYEQDAQCVNSNMPNNTVNASLTAELARYMKLAEEIVKPNHARFLVHDSEDTLEIAEIARKQMIEKMKDPECVKKKADSIKEKAKSAKLVTAMMVKKNNITIPDHVKLNVLAPGMYAIDVEPIPPRNKNNMEVHLEYLKHLKESVGTLREIVKEVVQIVLWYLDSGCSKHMTRDRSLLRNFVKKFIGTVKFKNDHFGAIMAYGDYVIGDSMISRAEVVASACYTQNRSLIHTRHNKTPYDLAHDRKHDLKFLCVFGAFCYLANDSEDLGKLRPTTDIGIFFGYALNRKGYRTYNRRT
uniref:Retrovirus-related Pol polyprotein from transposon TNT 1-94 n=1 Tax=Tanacetum cinerariifolium TaxID=118510 RepID=A0A699IBK2_TANCI|nr:retrovirus-related Pol polyprotein from transposon TNT 1-94 [Tanacetum cinerariifolium]